MVPYVGGFAFPQSVVSSWEKAWRQSASPYMFVLESGGAGRYSFFGADPVGIIRGKGEQAVIEDFASGRKLHVQGKPLELVKNWMKPFKSPRVPGLPKFVGGCVGFWGYDVARTIEKLPVIAQDDLPVPDYCFMMVNRLWIIDHREGRLYCAAHTRLTAEERADRDKLAEKYSRAADEIREMKSLWDRIAMSDARDASAQRRSFYERESMRQKLQVDREALSDARNAFGRDRYIDAVERIQNYIRAGDVFQVNLSVRQSRPLHTRPEEIYEWLRLLNPSPYMGHLRLAEFSLVSASPELLVRLEGDVVTTRPIAGTRPRGDDDAKDLALAAELINNEKERAEHVMLVDLERNDLGRISRFGTVKVKDFMVLERYSHVMHIVTGIESRLEPGKDAYDVMAAVFPGGTITGAPKIRTMEIIEELEPVRRGPYTGSIGWIDYNGNMEFNIVIRTLVTTGDTGYIQAGAGIVIDSVGEREYQESLNKAKALWKAIQYSEGRFVR